MTELEEVQSEYIKFLQEMLDSVEVILANHRHKWSDDNIKKGKDLRNKLKKYYKKNKK